MIKIHGKILDAINQINIKLELTNQEMNSRFEAMDQKMNLRFEAMDQKMNSSFEAMNQEMNSRFEAMDQKMNSRFEAMDQKMNSRFEAMNQKMNSRFKAMDQKMNTKFNEIDARFDNSDKNFEEIKQRLTSLENIVTGIEAKHGEKTQIALEYISGAIEQHDEIIDTLNKINSKLDGHDIHIEVLEEKVL